MKSGNPVFFFWAAAITILLFSPQAEAFILDGGITGGSVSGSGVFTKLTGFSGAVGQDTFQDNNLYAFDEGQNINIPFALNSDVGASPLPAGTEVASHYIFFDPQNVETVTGFVEFDSDVFSIITSTDHLAASDFLISNSVTYLNPELRGLESHQDSVSIDPLNPRRINLSFRASTPGDYIRVLTEHSPTAAAIIPEPMTMVLLGSGLIGCALVRRKQP